MSKLVTTMEGVEVEKFISKITSLPKDIWLQNKDLNYLFECAKAFRLNRPKYATQIFDIIENRIGSEIELAELKNKMQAIVNDADLQDNCEYDIYAAQSIEIIANDFWILSEMKKQGAGEAKIGLLKKNISEDSIEVGKRLLKNAIRQVQALKGTDLNLDYTKIKPLAECSDKGVFDINKDILISPDVHKIHLIINAGRSTRVRTTIPKGVIYANGKPLIQYTIDAGKSAGIEKTIVVLGFKKEINESFLEDDILIALQPTVEGTAHAVMSVFPMLQNFKGTLLISYSDMPFISFETLSNLIREHEANNSMMTILTTSIDKRPEFGRLIEDNQGNYCRISQVRIEDMRAKQVDSGFYCFKCPEFWNHLGTVKNENNRYEYYLTDIMSKIYASGGTIRGYETKNEIETFGINRPNEFIKALEIGHFLFEKKYSISKLKNILQQPDEAFEDEVLNFYNNVFDVSGKKLSYKEITSILKSQIGAILY